MINIPYIRQFLFYSFLLWKIETKWQRECFNIIIVPINIIIIITDHENHM